MQYQLVMTFTTMCCYVCWFNEGPTKYWKADMHVHVHCIYHLTIFPCCALAPVFLLSQLSFGNYAHTVRVHYTVYMGHVLYSVGPCAVLHVHVALMLILAWDIHCTTYKLYMYMCTTPHIHCIYMYMYMYRHIE